MTQDIFLILTGKVEKGTYHSDRKSWKVPTYLEFSHLFGRNFVDVNGILQELDTFSWALDPYGPDLYEAQYKCFDKDGLLFSTHQMICEIQNSWMASAKCKRELDLVLNNASNSDMKLNETF